MSVIFILIACSLLLAGSFLAAFLWASCSGQFEDDYTPSVRILFEEEGPTVSGNHLNESLASKKVVSTELDSSTSTSIKPNTHVRKQPKSRS